MDDLSVVFSALSSNEKAMFLARVAHDATILAREAYVRDYEHPDGVLLRKVNEYVHRVTGYILHVLNSTEGKGQDESVMAMIVHHAKESGDEVRLAKWLGIPNENATQ